jgi:hypothetical protein
MGFGRVLLLVGVTLITLTAQKIEANCVRIISPFENRPIDQDDFSGDTVRGILRGRLDPKVLKFEYAVSPDPKHGISILVYNSAKRHRIGNIEISARESKGNPRLMYVEVDEYYRGTGLAKLMILIAAKLSFEKYRRPLSGDENSDQYKTEWLWSSFVQNRVADWGDGFGQFKWNYLESSRLDELLQFFYSNAIERPLAYLVLPGAMKYH